MTDSAEALLCEGLDRILDVALFLKVSRSQVYALMDRGLLPYVRIGRSRRVPHRAVVEMAVRNLVNHHPSERAGGTI
jgi:excisionase family DNA binding protein